MARDVKNNWTAKIAGIAAGATASVSDPRFALIAQSPPFRAGLLQQPGQYGDESIVSDILTLVVPEYTMTGAADTHTFFTISGGKIELLNLSWEITTAMSSDASNASCQHVANEGPTTLALCTVVAAASTAKGKFLLWPGIIGNAMVKSAVGEGAISLGSVMLAEGVVQLVLSGLSSGKCVARMRYRKIDPFVSVT